MQQIFSGFPQGQLDINQAKFARVIYANGGTNYTIASGTLTAIDDTNLPVSVLADPGDVIELMFQGAIGLNSAGNLVGFDWAITRPTMSAIASLAQTYLSTAYAYCIWEGPTNGIDENNVNFTGYYTAIEAGVHTFKPRWRSTATGKFVMTDAGARTFFVQHSAKVIH